MITPTELLQPIRERLERDFVKVVERRDKFSGKIDYAFPDYEADIAKLLAMIEVMDLALEMISHESSDIEMTRDDLVMLENRITKKAYQARAEAIRILMEGK